MTDFALVNFRLADGPARAGVLSGDFVYAVPAMMRGAPLTTLQDVYPHWHELLPELEALPLRDGRPVAEIELLPPSLEPSAIYCAGINYQEHVDAVYRRQGHEPEPSLVELGEPSWHFLKARNTLRGHGAEIALPSAGTDWEIELAVVFGRAARNVSVEDALNYVAGYTIGIDLSARDMSVRRGLNIGSPFRYDWIAQKSFEGACPLGPCLVPPDRMPDPTRLGLRLWVNERLRQDSNTSEMLYTTAEQISHLSHVIGLSPGDVLLTGTPAGTGFETDEYLQPGDVIRASIDGIGELVVAMT
jgi:2-keto-4-pentenoate hydratase/2-oxohepta-3-ene-1,7-dioic acid hydratase in catechol pathway